jgi:hypothetical protein
MNYFKIKRKIKYYIRTCQLCLGLRMINGPLGTYSRIRIQLYIYRTSGNKKCMRLTVTYSESTVKRCLSENFITVLSILQDTKKRKHGASDKSQEFHCDAVPDFKHSSFQYNGSPAYRIPLYEHYET